MLKNKFCYRNSRFFFHYIYTKKLQYFILFFKRLKVQNIKPEKKLFSLKKEEKIYNHSIQCTKNELP